MDNQLNIKDLKPIQNRMKELGLSQEQVMKECSFGLQIISKSKQLLKCSTESKQSAILNVAQVGLTLNPVEKLAYLVPRWDSITRTSICCLEPSYQGLVKLLTDTGSVTAINTQLVYENDFFEVNQGDFDNPITHKPNPFKDRGKVIGCYSLAILPSGAKQCEIMDLNQLYEIREMSESYKAYLRKDIKSCVWIDHEGEMMRKTVLRRFVKYLPKSNQFKAVAEAISLDEKDYTPSDSKQDYALDLLRTSTITERLEIATYENQIKSGDSEVLNKIIEQLKERQFDNGRYSQTEIGDIVEEIAK